MDDVNQLTIFNVIEGGICQQSLKNDKNLNRIRNY